MRERLRVPIVPGGRDRSSGHGSCTGQGDGNSWWETDTHEWSSGAGFYEIDITQDRIHYNYEHRTGEGYGYGKLESMQFMQEVQALRGYY